MYKNEFIYNSIGDILCPLHKIFNIKKKHKVLFWADSQKPKTVDFIQLKTFYYFMKKKKSFRQPNAKLKCFASQPKYRMILELHIGLKIYGDVQCWITIGQILPEGGVSSERFFYQRGYHLYFSEVWGSSSMSLKSSMSPESFIVYIKGKKESLHSTMARGGEKLLSLLQIPLQSKNAFDQTFSKKSWFWN